MADDGDRITYEQLRRRQRNQGYVCDRQALESVRTGGLCKTAEKDLIPKVDRIKGDIGNRRILYYYIGKTSVDTKAGENFDRRNPNTWDTASIQGRWGDHNNPRQPEDHRIPDYNFLIVLTVIDAEVVDGRNFTHEDFALALEQRLIHHYKIDKNDGDIKNRTFNEGNRADRVHSGSAVYMAVKTTE